MYKICMSPVFLYSNMKEEDNNRTEHVEKNILEKAQNYVKWNDSGLITLK